MGIVLVLPLSVSRIDDMVPNVRNSGAETHGRERHGTIHTCCGDSWSFSCPSIQARPDSMTKTHAKKSEQKVRGASPRKYLGTVRRKYWDYVWKCATFRFPLISDNKLVGPCPYLYETDSAPTDPPDSSRLSATAAIFPLRNNKTRPSEQAKCQREIMTNSL